MGARIVVADAGAPGTPQLRHGAAGLAEGGRGLQVIDTLAAQWGSFRLPGAQAVWCDFGQPLSAPNLPAQLISDHLESEFIALREKPAEMDREELRTIGHRDYMILAPGSHVRHFEGKAAAAVRTLDELGLIIPLAD